MPQDLELPRNRPDVEAAFEAAPPEMVAEPFDALKLDLASIWAR